ncbi:MAG: hypothetical protein AB9897_01295 [Anaerolineaceae bacterium]
MTFKIDFPKIFKSVRLSEYAPEFGDAHLEIWVNFPQALEMERDSVLTIFNDSLEELEKAQKEEKADQEKCEALKAKIVEQNDGMKRWFGKVWYQDGNPLTEEEVNALFAQSEETDPQFTTWLIGKTYDLITEHRVGRKN